MPVAVAADMASDIIAAGISGITASADANGNLIITETSGGAITIANVSNDSQGNPFAGMNSISSLNTTNAGATGVYVLKLRREDGGEIFIRDVTGSATTDFGIMSGHNGSCSWLER